MKKIYVIGISGAFDFLPEERIEETGYTNIEDAKKRLLHLREQYEDEFPEWVQEDGEREVSLHEDGRYEKNHINMWIQEVKFDETSKENVDEG